MIYIPEWLVWIITGFILCILFSGIFTLIVNHGKPDPEINIDEEIRIFKQQIKKIFIRKKSKKKNEPKKLTKKEAQKKLKKMFKE